MMKKTSQDTLSHWQTNDAGNVNQSFWIKKSIMLAMLFFSVTQTHGYQEEHVGAQIIAEYEQAAKIDLAQKDIDAELYELFKKFFDNQDDMPFFQFVTKVISVLKTQKTLLSGHQQTKCDEMIKTFEKNKHATGFHIWAPILAAPDLRALMSPETRNYINSVSTQTKISALIHKLKK